MWTEQTFLVFPTSDVCRIIVTRKYAFSNRFDTTGFCGQVNGCGVNDEGNVVMVLEDPVEYIGVEIYFETGHDNEGQKAAEAFKDNIHVEKGK